MQVGLHHKPSEKHADDLHVDMLLQVEGKTEHRLLPALNPQEGGGGGGAC